MANSMSKGSLAKYRKLLKKYGLDVDYGKAGHLHIKKDGKFVSSCAGTARRGFEDSLFELSRKGYVPKELRRINF